MSKKENRGRKALPQDKKKPPQPTIKINVVLFPFVKLLKHEYKAKRVDAQKLQALTELLLDGKPDQSIEEQTAANLDAVNAIPEEAE